MTYSKQLPDTMPANSPKGQNVSSSRKRRLDKGKIISDIWLVIVFIIFLVPMLWLIEAAFDSRATLSLKIPEVSLDNFGKALTIDGAARPILNSLILSLTTSLIVVVCCVLAAYPLSRYRTRTGTGVMNFVLFASCLPIMSLMIPVYGAFVKLNLIDSEIGTILFMSACGLPMGIFMMKNFVDSVPITLEEAAWVDGASRMQTLTKIVVPLMMPSILVIFISEFVATWGNFFVPFILLLSPEKQPAAVTIFSFFGQHGSVAYGPLAAFSIVYSLPILLLYILSEKLIGNQALFAGAVKE